MAQRSWYRVVVDRKLYAASGEHVGQAIDVAIAHAHGGAALAVEPATGGDIPLGESVGKGHVHALGDAPELPSFHWPRGVLPTLAGAPALAGAQPGWVIRPDGPLLVIEAQTDAEHLVDLFEVRVLDHFEDTGKTDVWLTSRVNAKKVLRVLDEHDDDLIENGHVEISVYVRAHKATLRLSEHKTVVWLAEDRALEAEIARWLGELKIPRADALVTVRDAAHFHYRPARSKDRLKLGVELYRQRLRKVDVISRAKPQDDPATRT